MRFSLNYEFGGKPEEEEIARTEVSAPVLVAGSTRFGCQSPEMDAELI
jgi:hypothetical protein